MVNSRKYYRELVYLLIILIAVSCGKFLYSPYSVNVKKENRNKKNISKIDRVEATTSDNFSFIVLSDTHDYYSDLSKQVKYINRHKNEIKFVFHTGDATNLGMIQEWEEFNRIIDKLEVPFVMVIGNHDMLTNGERIYERLYSPDLDFFIDFKQTRFVFVNNNNWESQGEAPDISWLDQVLNSSTKTHNIILGHVQPDDPARYTEDEINEMKNIVTTHNVKYFINGHNHGEGDGSFASATRVTVGSPIKGKVLRIDITNAGVNHTFINF